MPIRKGSVREAILAMTADNSEHDRAAVALDIQYDLDEQGEWDFNNPPLAMIPTKWEDWVKLPIRDYDSVVHSAKLAIRAPTVVIAKNYHKMPKISHRPSKRTIYERDKGICQYTGKKLSFASASLDHVLPKSKGGKDTFENLVLCEAKTNHEKGNKSNAEAGLVLLRAPKAVPTVPASALIKIPAHFDWRWFLIK